MFESPRDKLIQHLPIIILFKFAVLHGIQFVVHCSEALHAIVVTATNIKMGTFLYPKEFIKYPPVPGTPSARKAMEETHLVGVHTINKGAQPSVIAAN